MKSCVCEESDLIHINETLSMVLTYMTSLCPLTCDPTRGLDCSVTYYNRTIETLVNGFRCDQMERFLQL